MPNPNVVPWGLHPLDPWIKTELMKRSAEVDMNSDITKYSGPRTAWSRFFSNGISWDDSEVGYNDDGDIDLFPKHDGFLMGAVNGFDDSYGFNSSGEAVLGYDATGKPHTIPARSSTSFPHRPPPAVDSIEVSLFGGQNSSFSGLCRKARVNWKCYSLDQLNYLAPYFLKPKVTALVEWGWNNYNNVPLMNLTDRKEMSDALLDGAKIMDRIAKSNGNYDAMMGFIFDYEFRMNALGGYDCYTEFVNANWLIEGHEYKSVSRTKTSKDKKTEVPLKSVIEFSDADLTNLSITEDDKKVKNIDAKGRFFVLDPNNSKNGASAGATKKKMWIRMDLVQEIFNTYFSMVFKDFNGNPIGSGSVLDISDTIICGHPAIKSVDEEVLIPNKYAPRFTTEESEKRLKNTSDQLLSNIPMIENQSYNKLFEKTGFLSTIESRKLVNEYDDLHAIIDPKNPRSFPMFETGKTSATSKSSPGTWGYLADIFVSTELVKDVIRNNETAYRMLDDLLSRINTAFCGIVQLKIVPHQYAARMSVIDTNYNPSSSPSSASDLTRFTPGSVESAFMTSVGFNVKLSQEMANQMVAQSSAGRIIGDVNLKVGMQKANRFVGDDRLYQYGTISDNTPSDYSPESLKEVDKRDFSNEFYFYQPPGSKRKNILVERDSEFMKGILSSDSSGKMIYINSPMMPGTKFEMETLGISGFTFLGQFTLDHVPKPYGYKECVWQIADIKQKVSSNTWTTTITADCRPLSYLN